MRNATGNYRIYSSLVKLQPCFPEFAVEGRTATFVPEFSVNDLSLAEQSDDIYTAGKCTLTDCVLWYQSIIQYVHTEACLCAVCFYSAGSNYGVLIGEQCLQHSL